MPDAVNYAEAYARALAQAYPNVLHFAALRSTENDARFQWTGANTIRIPTLSTTGRVDADRDTIEVAKRNWNNTWIPLTLGNFRKWSTLVHPMDIDETNQVASITNITRVYNEEQKFPEMDSYLISTLLARAVEKDATPGTEALTAENILTVFDAMMVNMTEARVPESGRVLYLTPHAQALLKVAKDMMRTFNVQNGTTILQRTVTGLDNVSIESVPSDLMKSEYDFTEGAVATETAKQIHMVLCHPSAVITPEKYTFAQLDRPCAGSEGKWVYYEESYDDAFLMPNKEKGIQFCMEA